MNIFNMTNEHLALLRHANVSWWSAEWGAPCIDPKRPYGNGDLRGDVASIIGIMPMETDDGASWPAGTMERVKELHSQTKTALQIVLTTGSFVPGQYESDDYRNNWRLKVPAACGVNA